MSPIKVVSRSVLRSNVAAIRRYADGFYAVVKADAYGHGLTGVVNAIEADGYCVARTEEGIAVRALTDRAVVVMGYVTESEAQDCARLGLTAALVDKSQVRGFCSAAIKASVPLRIWVAVDTGMHRFGLSVDEYRSLSLPPQLIRTGSFTHIGSPQRADSAVLVGGSALSYPATENVVRLRGLARIGLGLYGYGLDGATPAMSVETKIVCVRAVDAGEYIGYGEYFRTARPTRLAIAGVGYGDGFPRRPNAGRMQVNGEWFPIIGTPCMDSTFLDVTGACVSVGDRAVLENAGEMAERTGGIPYEYLTAWTPRVGIRYTD